MKAGIIAGHAAARVMQSRTPGSRAVAARSRAIPSRLRTPLPRRPCRRAGPRRRSPGSLARLWTREAQPKEVAHFNTWNDATAPGGPFEGALGIRVVGDKIYVADSIRGLLILKE